MILRHTITIALVTKDTSTIHSLVIGELNGQPFQGHFDPDKQRGVHVIRVWTILEKRSFQE